MPDAPTPLDLDAIQTDISWCRTYGFGMRQADRLAHEHAPALVAEVKRLRAARAEAWDEGRIAGYVDAADDRDPESRNPYREETGQ